MYGEIFSNIFLDKYYNELILIEKSIYLKNIIYSNNIFIIKKIISSNNFNNITNKQNETYSSKIFFLLLTNIKIKGKKKYIWISYGSDHNTLGIDSASIKFCIKKILEKKILRLNL
jgi:hypothetical protein